MGKNVIKSRIFNWIGFINVAIVFIYLLFIFLIGTKPQFIPSFLISSGNVRNLFISVSHTVGTVFAVAYFLHFLDSSMYDIKMAASGVVNVIIYILALVLVWYCYILQRLDPLMFVIAVEGMLLSILIWILSYVKYTGMQTNRTKTDEITLKLLSFSSLMCFLVGIFTYYGMIGRLLNSMLNVILTTNAADAMSLFLFLVGAFLQMVMFLLMKYMDRKHEEFIEHLKEEYRQTRKRRNN